MPSDWVATIRPQSFAPPRSLWATTGPSTAKAPEWTAFTSENWSTITQSHLRVRNAFQPTASGPAQAPPPKLPPPWEIRVDVYNGTGLPNAATRIANEVGGPLAYRIGTVKNAKRTDYIVTRVYYPPGAAAIAQRLAHQLGVGVTALPSGGDRNRLVVIVGSDRARGT